MARAPRPYVDPHLAGVALGCVLLACFAATGQGLGASGAFASVASGVAAAAGPAHATQNAWFAGYLQDGSPWTAWTVVEICGVLIGAAASAAWAGRLRWRAGGGERVSRGKLATALAGGLLMGIGSALARGCTSGLALSGGAMLSVGAWIFMVTLFAAGFLVAPLLRRSWS